eukprot:scaffold91206_cov35-Prasinocladus_malaysianus.AAC.1
MAKIAPNRSSSQACAFGAPISKDSLSCNLTSLGLLGLSSMSTPVRIYDDNIQERHSVCQSFPGDGRRGGEPGGRGQAKGKLSPPILCTACQTTPATLSQSVSDSLIRMKPVMHDCGLFRHGAPTESAGFESLARLDTHDSMRCGGVGRYLKQNVASKAKAENAESTRPKKVAKSSGYGNFDAW